MYRVNDNPISRFPKGRQLSEDKGCWVVVHLRSRREKAFALEMAEERIGYYLPLYEKRTRRRDGKWRKSIMPLFTSYVAVVVSDNKSEKVVRSSSHFANLIPVKNQGGFIRELSQIQMVLDGDIPFKFHAGLIPGDKVRVQVGPFAGVEGVISHNKKKPRLILSVEMFGQGISVDIDTTQVIKI